MLKLDGQLTDAESTVSWYEGILRSLITNTPHRCVLRFFFYHSSFFPADLQTSTSFPGSLIFPRSLWGGEIKYPGNEVAVNIWHFSPSQLLQWSRLPSADAPTPYNTFTNVHFNVGNMSSVVLWLRYGFEKSVFSVPLFCFSRFFSVYGIRKPPK